MRTLLTPLALLAATPALAGAETHDPATVPAGTYTIDTTHAAIVAYIGHLGFSRTAVRFDGIAGALDWDPAHPGAATVAVTVDPATLNSGMALRNEHLKGPGFFAVAANPLISFKGAHLARTGPDTARLPGELTLLGVTRPVVLTVKFNGFGKGMDGAPRIGFSAHTTIRRGDFGMKTLLGPITDEVELDIDAEFARK